MPVIIGVFKSLFIVLALHHRQYSIIIFAKVTKIGNSSLIKTGIYFPKTKVRLCAYATDMRGRGAHLRSIGP